MRGLYAIVDLPSLIDRGIDPVAFAAAVLRAGPAVLQLRAKDATPREVLALLRALLPMCRRAGVPLAANDRPDLAALAGCDIVHIGQEDMAIERVRRLSPRLRIGVSTHTPEQLERALKARPDYVAYGPVFPTPFKAYAPVGLEGLQVASAMAATYGIPLVALGGISVDNARDVAALADAGATIVGLFPAAIAAGPAALSVMDLGRVTQLATTLHERLGGETAPPQETEAYA